MSKSLGNGYTATDLTKMGIDPLAHKYLVLTSHYKKGLEFSLEAVKANQKALEKLRKLVAGWPEGGKVDEGYKQEFIGKLADDLGVPEGLALVWKLTKDSRINEADRRATILDMDRVLGLKLDKQEEDKIPKEVEKLAKKRQEARSKKDYPESDKLRDEISDLGFIIEDIEGNDYRIVKK